MAMEFDFYRKPVAILLLYDTIITARARVYNNNLMRFTRAKFGK